MVATKLDAEADMFRFFKCGDHDFTATMTIFSSREGGIGAVEGELDVHEAVAKAKDDGLQ